MELLEAYEKLKISKEERQSIERYVGFSHTSINILGDLTPQNYKRLKEGWKLPENKEEIKKCVEDFVNVYAAMCKKNRYSSSKGNFQD